MTRVQGYLSNATRCLYSMSAGCFVQCPHSTHANVKHAYRRGYSTRGASNGVYSRGYKVQVYSRGYKVQVYSRGYKPSGPGDRRRRRLQAQPLTTKKQWCATQRPTAWPRLFSLTYP